MLKNRNKSSFKRELHTDKAEIKNLCVDQKTS